MSKIKSSKKRVKLDAKSKMAYEAVISDAETMIQRLGDLSERLKQSVETFQDLRSEGVSFPGAAVAGTVESP